MVAEHDVKWYNEKRSDKHLGVIFECFLDSEFDDGCRSIERMKSQGCERVPAICTFGGAGNFLRHI